MKNVLLSTVTLSLLLTACDLVKPSADKQLAEKTEKAMQESVAQLGLPAITNFKEKRLLKQIYELRDKDVTTYTYIVDMNGIPHFLCRSLGYGLPYGTQYSNPTVTKNIYQSGVEQLPQAEPNGLFMPPSADATWVLCYNEESKQASPLYVEPKIIVSPFKLK
jgi:hypothetical protein